MDYNRYEGEPVFKKIYALDPIFPMLINKSKTL